MQRLKFILFLIVPLIILAGTLISCLPIQEVSQEQALIWDTWKAIREDYIHQDQIDLDKAISGAIQGMLEIAKEPSHPFLIELEGVPSLPPRQVPHELKDVWRAWELLLEKHPDLDRQLLAEAAIKGILQGLDDPMVQYIGRDEFKEVEIMLKGKYEGIGVTVSMLEDQFIIVALYRDSPAEQAGLQPGDIINSVDGEAVKGFTLQELANRIRGPEGSTVTLEILRPDEERRQIVEITRSSIDLPSILVQTIPGHIGYIAIPILRETTGKEVAEALEQLQNKDIEALILDLRSNPGGSLDAAIEVVSQFISEGLILSFIKPDGFHEDIYAKPDGVFLQPPLAVIVNEFTASAAEVVAAALQDWERAKIFGITTFGKGVSSTFRKLNGKAAIVLPNSEWYRPSGKTIHRIGVKPDVEVKLTLPDLLRGKDTQFSKAYHYLENLLNLSSKP